MDFHAFMYVTIGRRHELERGMAGKDPVLLQRMLDEIAAYARACDATGWELFEECVAIIKTAWTHDTFSFKGKYWSFPQEGQRQPHEHPVYLEYGRGVDSDGTIREVGIAPRPLQNPIPVYSGFPYSLQTSLYWAMRTR